MNVRGFNNRKTRALLFAMAGILLLLSGLFLGIFLGFNYFGERFLFHHGDVDF